MTRECGTMDLELLRRALGNEVRENEPLSRHTTFGIGGPADLLVVAYSLETLREAVARAYECQVPYVILGGGANLLVSDKGVRGLVIQNRCQAARFVPEDEGTVLLEVESGAMLAGVA